MIGAYITFAVAVAIPLIYMLIVHSFLRSAEEPQDEAREKKFREAHQSRHEPSGRAQYAH